MHGLPDSARLGWNDVYIVHTRDGSETLFSRTLNCTYHSQWGAVSESRHVFIQEGLETQRSRKNIRILEFGFGTGLNAFLAYLFSNKHQLPVFYLGIEASPISPDVALKLDYPGYLHADEERPVFLRMHDSESFDMNRFSFHHIALLENLDNKMEFDCIFFDAFAPLAAPQQWTEEVFAKLYELTSLGGCLVTYCAQGDVRRRMQAVGYKVERLPGAPGKREMLRAVKIDTA